MQLTKEKKILIVGLGLIGGSYAQALSQQGFEVGAVDTCAKAIDYALDKHWIQSGRTTPERDYIGRFDWIIFALYPHVFIEWIRDYQAYIKPGALLTDATGVKSGIVYKIQEMLRSDLEFIGAHPMAGREKSGVENADMHVFLGANYIVTPTDRNSREAIEACKSLGRVLGFGNISELSPEKHDEMIGFLSQLTHCIAVSLMICHDTQHLADYAGDSFRDLTRIAKINDAMWSELFLMNKAALLSQMKLFDQKFHDLQDAIENDNEDKIREMMRLSTERRIFYDNK